MSESTETLTLRLGDLRADEDKDLHLLTEQQHELVSDSPYVAAQSFESLGLPEPLLRGVYAKRFNRPSRIQAHALPALLAGRNLIAQSLSGTGKTAAFALGMLARVEASQKRPQAVCVSPTRELARQIADVAEELAQFSGIEVGLCVPGSDLSEARGPVQHQVLVGTPGKLCALVQQRRVAAKGVKMLVFDEADVLLDRQGLGDQSLRLASMLQRGTQIVLFSATFADEVAQFAEKVVPQPQVRIGLREQLRVVDLIKQLWIRVAPAAGSDDAARAKFEALERVYESISVGQSIIFVQTRRGAEDLAARMSKAGHAVGVIHGDLETSARDEVIDDFRAGRTRVLLSTNVLARGIDVLAVSLVVNFDMPVGPGGQFEEETYLHRIGRTARYGRSGVALSFVSGERELAMLEGLRDKYKCELQELPVERIAELSAMLVACKKSDRERLKALKIEAGRATLAPAAAKP